MVGSCSLKLDLEYLLSILLLVKLQTLHILQNSHEKFTLTFNISQIYDFSLQAVCFSPTGPLTKGPTLLHSPSRQLVR